MCCSRSLECVNAIYAMQIPIHTTFLSSYFIFIIARIVFNHFNCWPNSEASQFSAAALFNAYFCFKIYIRMIIFLFICPCQNRIVFCILCAHKSKMLSTLHYTIQFDMLFTLNRIDGSLFSFLLREKKPHKLQARS